MQSLCHVSEGGLWVARVGWISASYVLAEPNNRLQATANSRSEERAEAIGGA